MIPCRGWASPLQPTRTVVCRKWGEWKHRLAVQQRVRWVHRLSPGVTRAPLPVAAAPHFDSPDDHTVLTEDSPLLLDRADDGSEFA